MAKDDGKVYYYLMVWGLPFTPLIYFFIHKELGGAIWEAIKFYEFIWWLSPGSATICTVGLHYFFKKEYTKLEGVAQWFVWTICMFLCFGFLYSTTTPGLEGSNFINTHVTGAYHQERYETRHCSTDDDGVETCSCTPHGPYWYLKTAYSQEVTISRSIYNKYRARFETVRSYAGSKGGEGSCYSGTTWVLKYNPSKPWTKKSSSVPMKYVNFEHASRKATGLDVTSINPKYSKYIESYPTTENWGWGNIDVTRVKTVGLDYVDKNWIRSFSMKLNDELIELGEKHHANVFIKLVSSDDTHARHGVDKMWLGGQKNDIILVIGVDSNWKIHHVNGLCPGVRENLNSEFIHSLEDNILELGDLKNPNLIQVLSHQISQPGKAGFTRAHTEKMLHFLADIPVPIWKWLLTVMFCLLLNGLLTNELLTNDIRNY